MDFDVIIIGGSYAGLSAALALGRSTRNVLVIDAGKPCNRQTPHSHNFLTHDGDRPADIAKVAKEEVLKYPTVRFLEGKAISAKQMKGGFSVGIEDGQHFTSRKLLLATGLKDTLPDIKGLAACWAISAIHCPYCHGYEVKNEKIALLMNGDHAFEMAKTVHLWNNDLTILTNGKSGFTAEQAEKLKSKSITVLEEEIIELENQNGQLENIVFKNGKRVAFKAIYVKPDVEQHINFSGQLGFELTDLKTIKVNEQHQTTAMGVYAAGDCATMLRSLPIVTAAGTIAAVMINKELISEDF